MLKWLGFVNLPETCVRPVWQGFGMVPQFVLLPAATPRSLGVVARLSLSLPPSFESDVHPLFCRSFFARHDRVTDWLPLEAARERAALVSNLAVSTSSSFHIMPLPSLLSGLPDWPFGRPVQCLSALKTAPFPRPAPWSLAQNVPRLRPPPRLSFTAHSLLLSSPAHDARPRRRRRRRRTWGTQRAIPSSASARRTTNERLSLPFSLPGGGGDLDGFLLPFLSLASDDDEVWSYATLPDSFGIRGRGLKFILYRFNKMYNITSV